MKKADRELILGLAKSVGDLSKEVKQSNTPKPEQGLPFNFQMEFDQKIPMTNRPYLITVFSGELSTLMRRFGVVFLTAKTKEANPMTNGNRINF